MADPTAPKFGPYGPAAEEIPEFVHDRRVGTDRRDTWEWTHKRVAIALALVTILSAGGTTMITAMTAQGWRTQSPADVTRGQDTKIDATNRTITRLVPYVEAGARYTCSKDLPGAQQAGYPCSSLLDGHGILSGSAARTPPDGSAVLAIGRVR